METPDSLVLDEFVALRAKAFAHKYDDKEERKSFEGFTQTALKFINFNKFENCLNDKLAEHKKNIKKTLLLGMTIIKCTYDQLIKRVISF